MIFAALISWPFVVMGLFARYRVQLAIVISILAGYLLLPTNVGLDLPALPRFDKVFMAGAMVIMIALLSGAARKSPQGDVQSGWLPQNKWIMALVILLFASDFITVMANRDPITIGGRFLPGLRPYDGFSSALNSVIMLSPFLLARKFLSTPAAHLLVLKALAIAAACYALLALYEVRMSPQLNQTVYGYFPHEWIQHRRGNWWRPIVFLDHGLMVGIFFATSCLAAIAAFRADKGARFFLGLAGWIFFALLMASTLGAFAIAILLAPAVLLLNARLQLLLAAVIAGIVLLYPTLRNAGYIPTERVLGYAQSISEERAGSLQLRLENEDIFLERAAERPLFGWGGWGRARMYNAQGRDVSVADGAWVITFVMGGWLRYLGIFGLLCIPPILLAFSKRHPPNLATSGLCLVLCANLIDLIPNSGLNSLLWLVAGALVGLLERQRATTPAPQEVAAMPTKSSPYTRQHARHVKTRFARAQK
jgi:hypothetical protein